MIEINKIHNMDCLKGLKQLQDNSIDLVVIDPPYNIAIDEWDKFDDKKYLKWMEIICDELIRVTKRTSSIYIFGDFRFIADIKVMMNKKNVSLTSWIIWDKGSKEQNAIRSYANVTEHILFFTKPKSQINNPIREYLNNARIKKKLSLSDINKSLGWASTGGGCASCYMGDKRDIVIPSENHYNKLKELLNLEKDYNDFKELVYTFNHESIRIKRNPRDKRKFSYDKQIFPNVWYFNDKTEMMKYEHPTVKPIDLIRTIIKASSNMGDTVLDCFMGSGTTAVACKQLGRNFIGFELSKKYVEIANKRLCQNVLLPLTEKQEGGTGFIPTLKGLGIRPTIL